MKITVDPVMKRNFIIFGEIWIVIIQEKKVSLLSHSLHDVKSFLEKTNSKLWNWEFWNETKWIVVWFSFTKLLQFELSTIFHLLVRLHFYLSDSPMFQFRRCEMANV